MSHDLPGLQGLEGRIRGARGGKESGEGQYAADVQNNAEGVDPEDEGEEIGCLTWRRLLKAWNVIELTIITE